MRSERPWKAVLGGTVGTALAMLWAAGCGGPEPVPDEEPVDPFEFIGWSFDGTSPQGFEEGGGEGWTDAARTGDRRHDDDRNDRCGKRDRCEKHGKKGDRDQHHRHDEDRWDDDRRGDKDRCDEDRHGKKDRYDDRRGRDDHGSRYHGYAEAGRRAEEPRAE